MRAGDIEFVRGLVSEFPELRSLLDEHLEDNFGRVLPHPFLADVLREALTAVEADQRDCGLDVEVLLNYLEEAFREGDEERQELISTGFVENLPRSGEPGYAIRGMLGPALRAEAERVA